MGYSLPKDLEEFRKVIRSFAEEKVKPIAFHLDQTKEFPKEIVKEMGEMGLMGIPFPEEFGGAGLTNQHYAIAVEELSRVDGGVGVICSAHTSLGTWGINEFGNQYQKEKYLKPLASGKVIGGFGLTEENAGSDSAGTETTAVLKGDHYLLNGKKIFITNAPEAQTYLVTAVTQPGKGNHGISMFIVDKDFEGFTFSEPYDKLGIRSSITAELHFKDVKVPKENLLGEEGKGFKYAMMILDGGRIGIASQALGIAQGAYESAKDYALAREQFGKAVGRMQHNAFIMADMATELKAARLLIYDAAKKKDAHLPYGMDAAMAKLYASDMAEKLTSKALQLYGGSGFIKGVDVERFYRDSKITQIYEGTNEIMRLVISGYIFPKQAKKEEVKKEAPKKKQSQVGDRKLVILKGDEKEVAKKLVEALKADGFTFDKKDVDLEDPIESAEGVVVAGMGIGEEQNLEMLKELAKETGSVLSSTRPAAQVRGYVPTNRFIGLSGKKYSGKLYIGVGVSGAMQHLRGIGDAGTIIVINNDESANFFNNCDYGIIGDFHKVVPALIEEIKNA
ncbi:acyl-CoA dehydrogenase family protein [uncultured Anaerococcus sp.]|uniref:acyl-CoA dehydrogenase family protein n=1 Tax=uncultured Anaerococcus sp. TaxID=293428 RepID=UPI00261A563A|nr:acyl-CoA dehydrogenase family protein [uncultured Anaerococcus sp.]